jgi:hypothetical protein
VEEAELPPDPAPDAELAPAESAAAHPIVFAPVVPISAVPAPIIPAPIVAAPTPHADRTTGLVIFGIAQIILGLLAALMIPLVALAAVMSRLGPASSMHPGQMISGASTYFFAAIVFITLGIGSVQYRRWARALTLVTSWYWLIMGALVTVLITAVLPVMMKTLLQTQQNIGNAQTPALSPTAMAIIVTLVIIFFAFFLIVVPIAFVVFYGREDVALTCRDRDPIERWTDRTPLPVLGASVVFFVGALYMLVVAATSPVFPFFGKYLTGIPAAACLLVLAAIDGYLAIASFRLKLAAWWLAIITLALRLLSMSLTYVKADLVQAYSQMGRSDAELRMLESSPLLRGHVFLWWSLLSLLIFLGYLIWIKRYFDAPVVQPDALEALAS